MNFCYLNDVSGKLEIVYLKPKVTRVIKFNQKIDCGFICHPKNWMCLVATFCEFEKMFFYNMAFIKDATR